MVLLPKALYLLEHVSTCVPRAFFDRLHAMMATFVWGRARRKLALRTLQRAKQQGGAALPDFFIYFLAGQLRYLTSWVSTGAETNAEYHLQTYLQINTMWPVQEGIHLFRGSALPLHRLAHQVWRALKPIDYKDLLDVLPLWDNALLPSLEYLEGVDVWKKSGVFTLKDLYKEGTLMSFTELQEKHGIARTHFFRYLQMRHALRAQFQKLKGSISTYPLIGILNTQGPRGMISSLYTHLLSNIMTLKPLACETKWKHFIPEMSDEEWQEALEVVTKVSPSVNNKLIQLYIVHRSYLTPLRLHKMGRLSHDRCHSCGRPAANFEHLMWDCSYLQGFWSSVIATLSTMVQPQIPMCPKICILGVLDEECWTHHDRIFLSETLFLARKSVDNSPTISQWISWVNQTVGMEKVVYKHRGCPQKFQKVWGKWCESTTTLMNVVPDST